VWVDSSYEAEASLQTKMRFAATNTTPPMALGTEVPSM